MKKLLLLSSIIVCLTAQVVDKTNPSRELIFNVNSSTNLNAASIRITVQEFTLDPTLTLNFEAWNDEVPPAIVTKKSVTLTAVQVKAFVNAPDPKAYLKAAVLAKANLTEKP
jgi:hypothetical protein